MRKGFSLIELIVVVVIAIGLSTMVLLNLNLARAKNRDSQRIADITALSVALRAHLADSKAYPTETAIGDIQNHLIADGYLEKAVSDPQGNQIQCQQWLTAAGTNKVASGFNFIKPAKATMMIPVYINEEYQVVDKTTSTNVNDKGYYIYTVLENQNNQTVGTKACDATWGAKAYILKDGQVFNGTLKN